ncbi:rop guanine nucleotide exchange factor 1-like isoform X2 [Ricinus communis]|uniref:rop guanine nucleotide exchange factor 1-like isoform X2 n=1 Tax=Ricinus communis TaxID=3988 RepID=UPI00201A2F03|nr:rop guanine nucleotide exchange factor 1-like isoform X2 [Ricinus communis]
MGTISSEEELDQLRERFEFDSYTSSADVSESKSSSSFSCHHYEHQRASTSSPPFLDRFFSPPSLPIMLPVVPGKHVMMKMEENLSDVEMMKERFAKLLLGEDMSGGGKGVCTALAISNAITNLSASVFGELRKLEPLAPQKKSMWHREMDLLLCVSDSIVELVPSMQNLPGGGTFEVMVPRPRLDLFMNLPALKKLETMLLSILDGFCDAEFYYVDRGVIVAGGNETETFSLSSSSARPSISREEKWWLPFPKVPQNGLSEDARKRLQQCKECTNQILKVAMAINGSVLTEMEIPSAINGSLVCLSENIYRRMTTSRFSPDCLLDYLDLSSEYSILEIANRIEAAAHIWRKRYLKGYKAQARAQRKSTWRGRVKGFVGEVERNKLLARRAETLLHSLRLRFPALPQTTLDSYKIQYNKDVGHAIIESYSRVMESLAYNILARIDDLLYVDDATKQRAAAESTSLYDQERLGGGALSKQRQISPSPFSFQHSFSGSSCPLSNLDSSHDKIRTPNGHDFTKKSNLRNSPIQTLQKLTF